MMSEFTPESEQTGRLITHASDMYYALRNAINVLRCAGVGDTRRALSTAHEIERMLDSIDGKTNNNGNKKKLLQCPFCGNTNLTKLDRKGCCNEGFFCPVCEMSFVVDDMNEGEAT